MICPLEHSRVAGIKFLPLFSRGLLPVETESGESPVFDAQNRTVDPFFQSRNRAYGPS